MRNRVAAASVYTTLKGRPCCSIALRALWRTGVSTGFVVCFVVSFAVLTAALAAGSSQPARAQEYAKPLPAEPIPAVTTLKTPYPKHYALVHDFGFGSLIDSTLSVVDTQTRKFKGMVSAGNFATANWSAQRGEIYVGETYYSRGTRGIRSDLLTIYDMATLDRIAEVDLPPKRAAIVVHKNATQITTSGRFMLVFNLNPGTSVSVIDLDNRKFVGEIPAPGCSLLYPTQKHDFFMLCGDGAALSISLDEDGREKKRKRTEPFIDIDNDPLSEKASKIGSNWHFISFKGDVQPIRTRRDAVAPAKRWSLTSAEERAANWRPAGWHWSAARGNDLWVIMTPDGFDGSHKFPGTEVWRFDVRKKRRTARIELQTPGLSIDVTDETEPKLLVVNAAGSLDVYTADKGSYLRSVHDLGASPYQVHRLR